MILSAASLRDSPRDASNCSWLNFRYLHVEKVSEWVSAHCVNNKECVALIQPTVYRCRANEYDHLPFAGVLHRTTVASAWPILGRVQVLSMPCLCCTLEGRLDIFDVPRTFIRNHIRRRTISSHWKLDELFVSPTIMSLVEPPCLCYWNPVLLCHVQGHVAWKGCSFQDTSKGLVDFNSILVQESPGCPCLQFTSFGQIYITPTRVF